MPQAPGYANDSSHATALLKAKNRKEQKMWEKTRGDRKRETENFVKEKFAESHLEQILKEGLLELALTNLKVDNLIENKNRNLLKFEKAKQNNPDLPFIPKSASNFELNGTEAVKGTDEFDLLQQQCKKITEKFNKDVSDLCYQVGLLEKKVLIENRVKNFLTKGLTLSFAMLIFRTHEKGLQTPSETKKIAAYALFGSILGSEKLMNFVSFSKEQICKLLEDEFKTYNGFLNLRSLSLGMCANDQLVVQEVIKHLTEPLCIVTVDAWEYLMKNQEERRRKMEVL